LYLDEKDKISSEHQGIELFSNFKSFKTIVATIYKHYEEILNFFVNRSTNASAVSFNAKSKSFNSQRDYQHQLLPVQVL
jgi:hypothetical protein